MCQNSLKLKDNSKDETEIIVLVKEWLKLSALLESVMQNIGKDTD